MSWLLRVARAPEAESAAAWGERPAGFWVRGMAQCIDGVVLVAPMISGSLIIALLLNALKSEDFSTFSTALAVSQGILLIVGVLYSTWMTATFGRTLGKKFCNLKVVRAQGQVLSWPRAFGRYAVFILASVGFAPLHCAAAFTPKKRALHDYVFDTRVIRTGPLSPNAVVLAWILAIFFLSFPPFVAYNLTRLLHRSEQDATRNNLVSIKQALEFHRIEKKRWPSHLEELVPVYADEIPQEKITKSKRSSDVFDGKGGWVYVSKTGTVLLNLDGLDQQGHPYRDYGQAKP